MEGETGRQWFLASAKRHPPSCSGFIWITKVIGVGGVAQVIVVG
jgi:hypothetical protein